MVILVYCQDCPKPEILEPCICKDRNISCGDNGIIDLKAIFHRLDSELEDGKKHFKQFFLYNIAISELAENTFGNITFDSITIGSAINLSLIHTNAFTAMNHVLKSFYVYDTLLKNFPPNYDIFTALSHMTQIEIIAITYSKLEEIPENSFQPLSGQQNNLTKLQFFNNNIKKIGNNAFQHLSSLKELNLYHNQIDHIQKDSFKFLNKTALSELVMGSNLLNSSSFESGALSYLTGPLFLELGSDNLKFFDQQIFEIFFLNNEENRIREDNLDCEDCRSYWLFKNQKFANQIQRLNCANGYKLFSDKTNFQKCAQIF
jgi:Leucine-rich repeat (LRR) protein